MKELLNKYQNIINPRLNELLTNKELGEKLSTAMQYSVMAGGKRLRPILALLANNLLNGETYECLDIACAIEFIHTYSLIHDDLPAMDNDDLRRGKPTNHVVFGEGFAILAGDALLNYAYEIMLNNAISYPANIHNHVLAINEIAKGSGAFGMIEGQCLDIENEGKTLNIAKLEKLHKNKTGAIIAASLKAGLQLCSPSSKQTEAVNIYGEKIGLAFQVIDDILDVIGNAGLMGKTLNKDEKANKTTYVSLFGIEKSKAIAKELTDEAICALEIFNTPKDLCKLAIYLLNRQN